eukprot:gene21886-27962_t
MTSSSQLKTERVAESVSEMIGDSEGLFLAFADHCVETAAAAPLVDSSDTDRSSLLLDSSTNDRLSDLVSLVDRWRRHGRADYSDIDSLFDIMRSLITLQTSALNKTQHLKDVQSATSVKSSSSCSATVPSPNSTSSVVGGLGGVKRKQTFDSLAVDKKPKTSTSLSTSLRTALKFLVNLDSRETFARRVSDKIAPDYSKVIKRPVSIRDISKKVESKDYNSLRELDDDVRQMFSNCVLYNGSDSEYGNLAQKYAGKWRIQYKMLTDESAQSTGQQMAPSRGSSDGSSSSSAPAPAAVVEDPFEKVLARVRSRMQDLAMSGKERLRRVLNIALDFAASLDQFDLFASPVLDSQVPDYSKFVKNKMAFSDIRRKIEKEAYSSLVPFDADLILIADNCAVFNAQNPPILEEGERLRREWTRLYSRLKTYPELVAPVPPDVKTKSELQSIAGSSSTATGESVFGFHKVGGAPIRVPLILTAESLRESIAGLTEPAAILRRVLHVVWQYAGRIDEQGYFASPVQVEGYQKVVTNPMDLSIMQKRLERNVYRSLESFESDLSLVYSNCFLFNKEFSDVFRAAERLQYGTALSLKNVRAVLSNAESTCVVLESDHCQASEETVPADDEGEMIEEVATATATTVNNLDTAPLLEVAPTEHEQVASMDVAPVESASLSITEDAKDSLTAETKSAAESNGVSGTAVERGSWKPSFDQLLQSSRDALSVLQAAGPSASKTVDLPALFTDAKLSWATVILRDAHLQGMLTNLLAHRLFEMGAAAMDFKLVGNVNANVAAPVVLPHTDPLVRALGQLCQLTLVPFAYQFNAVDDNLVRVHFPALLFALFSEQQSFNDRVGKAVSSTTNNSAACGKVAVEMVASICERLVVGGKAFDFLVALSRVMLQISFDKK